MPSHGIGKIPKVVYPQSCKEISGELSKEELLKRMKSLAKAFQEMGQDENEKYKGLSIYLASELFMDHSSKDVKLLTACCIADIFRIFAPEAPFKEDSHIKEIFMFFVDQLRGLEDTEAPSFKRYFYLLENLAWVKSFNICLEFEDNQEIFCRLFKLMFSIVNNKHSTKVKNFMMDMMCPLITEADSVSQELLDTILLCIIDPNKSLNKEAYQLAKDLIKRTANSIEPYIQAFFNNVLMLGKTSESEVSDRLFPLIYELNQISPSVLLAVLPQLEYKLKSNDDGERKSVTRLLSRMFSDKNSDLAVTNKNLWRCYLGRFNDINLQVRTVCVQQSQHFILNHPELVKDITEHLKLRLHDSEESVRMDVVTALVSAAKKDLRAVTNELLEFVKERTLDKKFRIRKEALLGLGWIYRKCLQKEDPDPDEMKRIGWIRDKVMHGYYQTSIEDRVLIEKIYKICLVPYTMDQDTRMKTLYHLYVNLDENAVKAWNEMLRCHLNVVSTVRQWLDLLNKDDTNEIRQLIISKVLSLTKALPDHSRASEHMKKFGFMVSEDARIRHNLATLVSPGCTCKKAEECVREILKKLGHVTPQNVFYTCIKTLLERLAPVHIDVNTIKVLIKLVNDSVSGIADIDDDADDCGYKGMKLLLMLSTVYPGAFDSDDIYRVLLPFLKNEMDDIVDLAIQIFKNTGAKIQEDHEEVYENMLPVLIELAKTGTPEQAKHSLLCICTICADKNNVLSEIFDVLKQALDPAARYFQTALVSLGHIAQMCPGEFAIQMKSTIVKAVVKDLLMKTRERRASSAALRNRESWIADDAIPTETMTKMRAMKLMVRWLIGLKGNAMANNSGVSTLRMLYTTILNEGDLMESGLMSPGEMARLRLQAGCCMLKLAQESVYIELITQEQFQGLALLINDRVYEVRSRFAQKLHKGLMSLQLKLEYLSIFALAANDPMKERRTQVKGLLLSNINKRREILRKKQTSGEIVYTLLPDYVLPYVIHLLAHDPDFKDLQDVDMLNSIKDCLWFIMEPLINKNENYSYQFYHKIFETIKETKDAQDPNNEEANHRLYAVCDLALGIVATKTTTFMLKEYPVKPVLPKKLYIVEDEPFTNTKFYLPQEFAFSPPKKKQAAASLLHGAAQIAQKPNKLLNGIMDKDGPESPGSVKSSVSAKSDKSNESKVATKKAPKRQRQTKSKEPETKKARVSSPASDRVPSPAENGASSPEPTLSPTVPTVKSPANLKQTKLNFATAKSSRNGKENTELPKKVAPGKKKAQAKDSSESPKKVNSTKKKVQETESSESPKKVNATKKKVQGTTSSESPKKVTSGKRKVQDTESSESPKKVKATKKKGQEKESSESPKKVNAGKRKMQETDSSESPKKVNAGKKKALESDSSDSTKKVNSARKKVQGTNSSESPKKVNASKKKAIERDSSESPKKVNSPKKKVQGTDSSESPKKVNATKKKAQGSKNSAQTPQKDSPKKGKAPSKALNISVSKDSPQKGQRSTKNDSKDSPKSPLKKSQESGSKASSRNLKGSISVKLSPKKKTAGKKTVNSSPTKVTKNRTTLKSPVKQKLTPQKRKAAVNKGKVSPLKTLKRVNSRKALPSPAKSVSSSSSKSSLKSGPTASPRRASFTKGARGLSKSPARSPAVVLQKSPGGKSSQANKAKGPVKNIRKAVRKMSPMVEQSPSRKRSLSSHASASESPAKRAKMTRTSSQSSSTTIPSTSSSRVSSSPSPKKKTQMKVITPRKKPNTRRIPNGTSDGSSADSTSSSLSPRKSPRKPVPKMIDGEQVGIKRKTRNRKR